MKVTFLGTKGEIKVKSRYHRMHTSTLFDRVMIDCGTSFLGKLKDICPDHILLTHAHPDHVEGLKHGAPCLVWATKKTWKLIDKFPIPKTQRRIMVPRKKKRIGGIQFEAFEVLHSIRCPAVGYRITKGKNRFFYVPDVAYIPKLQEAFKGIQYYIGDGATITRPMIRKVKGKEEIFGHATIRQQLTWCQKQKVKKMIITHCGSAIVANRQKAKKQIEKLANAKDIEILLAYDQMTLHF